MNHFRILTKYSACSSITACLLASPIAFGADEEMAFPARSFQYNVQAGLILIDALKVPNVGSSAIAPPGTSPTESSSRRGRSVGLEYAKFLGRWSLAPTATMSWTLRPDALTRRSDLDNPPAVREFDSRVGNLSTQKSRLSLLDAYALEVQRGKSFQIAIGVIESLTRRETAYREPLEFGLTVPFPSKTSAVRASLSRSAPDQQRRSMGEDWNADVYLFQGEDDRTEVLDDGSKTFDHAPTSADSYQGGAGEFTWRASRMFDFIGFFGGGDVGLQDGKRNEFLTKLAAIYRQDAGPIPARVSFEARLKREKWNTPTSPRAPLEHRSFSLTGMIFASGKLWGLFGAHLGSVQSHSTLDSSQTNVTNGYQLELGLMQDWADGLQLMLSGAQERREFTDDDGSKYGAFGARSDTALHVRRFALRLSYAFGGT